MQQLITGACRLNAAQHVSGILLPINYQLAYQLQQQPLVYRTNVVVAVLLAVVGPVQSFKYRSTYFGHPLAHHQEPINCSSSLWFTVGTWW